MPEDRPIITGGAPFRAAEHLSGFKNEALAEIGIRALSKVLSTAPAIIEQRFLKLHFHDWQSDPFSRGAYSFGKVGAGGDAAREMSIPVQNTLYFAGEATDTGGNSGTVHGAIASGYRAASQILQSLS